MEKWVEHAVNGSVLNFNGMHDPPPPPSPIPLPLPQCQFSSCSSHNLSCICQAMVCLHGAPTHPHFSRCSWSHDPCYFCWAIFSLVVPSSSPPLPPPPPPPALILPLFLFPWSLFFLLVDLQFDGMCLSFIYFLICFLSIFLFFFFFSHTQLDFAWYLFIEILVCMFKPFPLTLYISYHLICSLSICVCSLLFIKKNIYLYKKVK